MSQFSDAADAIERALIPFKPLLAAADALRELGSLDSAAESARGAVTNAEAEIASAKAELAAVYSDIAEAKAEATKARKAAKEVEEKANEKAAQIEQAALQNAEALIQGAKDQAKAIAAEINGANEVLTNLRDEIKKAGQSLEEIEAKKAALLEALRG